MTSGWTLPEIELIVPQQCEKCVPSGERESLFFSLSRDGCAAHDFVPTALSFQGWLNSVQKKIRHGKNMKQ